MNNSRYIKHLYARAGFGICFEDLHDHEHWSVRKAVKKIFKASEKIEPITAVTENMDLRPHPKDETEDQKKTREEERVKHEKALFNAWTKQLIETNAQLREKMTLFWHNHFACNINNPYYEQELNNIERANALGNFKTLLIAVTQSPAMLQFLNNQQNQKVHPNENFARELMELFTLGRGNYSEQDIKESARAFTGWAYGGKEGEYFFKTGAHDDGIKTFMGRSANFCGEDIIDIIVAQKQTAVFISTKLYRYFVNDVPDMSHINEMANVFYNTGYEITPVLEYMFMADWFYADKNIGNLIKSPVELIIGLSRQFYITYQNPDVLVQFQQSLGQVLFRPPNVAGWPGGRSWIDSSSLMTRLRMPAIILNAGLIDFTGKAGPEDEAYLALVRKQQFDVIKRVQATPDWDRFFKAIPQNMPKKQIAEFMLEPPVNALIINEINNAPDLKTALIQIVSTPEYQLT
ncbi:uncharacterized protein (DUF1800 family) [Mucilaginibacter frigoritolerans]|uniref:Uncharacterized protein (DUF1800 family) n=1 Tax=Mucilaginibacter frigoritolerans TaxID=652788 RepID=A0A562U0U2_9SPHI|nr:DUF1800 domain-containing protein [Mucilaginibacter frigoritolerans]TWI99469.1 uncharacterized protein (DUF1800 family) [Mucilaginibacter frigoritolerans]